MAEYFNYIVVVLISYWVGGAIFIHFYRKKQIKDLLLSYEIGRQSFLLRFTSSKIEEVLGKFSTLDIIKKDQLLKILSEHNDFLEASNNILYKLGKINQEQGKLLASEIERAHNELVSLENLKLMRQDYPLIVFDELIVRRELLLLDMKSMQEILTRSKLPWETDKEAANSLKRILSNRFP